MANLTELSPRPTEQALAALQPLVDAARDFAAEGKAAATRKAYRRDWNAFTAWCHESGLCSLPARPEAVAVYVSYMAAEGLKPSTIQRATVAISQAHKMAGHESPTTTAPVRETLKGIRRKLGTAQDQKAPVVTSDLRRMLAVTSTNLKGVRDRALLLLGFAGAFRRSEVVALDVNDVEFTEDGLIIMIRKSKTDQEAAGRKIGIPFGSSPATCPVRALRRWLEAADITSGPIFRPINRWGSISGRRLSGRAAAEVVKEYAVAVGLDPTRFAGHSLRAGFATSAAKAGKSERSIMKQTGHRSVQMVRKYIREGSLFTENAAAGLL